MSWRPYITTEPDVCQGRACFRGTRIAVSVILDNLAAGQTVDEIVAQYPPLGREAVRAALAYGSDLARENEQGVRGV